MWRDVSVYARYHYNLRYYQRLTEGMRDALDNGTFDEFVQDFYARRGLEVPPCPVDE